MEPDTTGGVHALGGIDLHKARLPAGIRSTPGLPNIGRQGRIDADAEGRVEVHFKVQQMVAQVVLEAKVQGVTGGRGGREDFPALETRSQAAQVKFIGMLWLLSFPAGGRAPWQAVAAGCTSPSVVKITGRSTSVWVEFQSSGTVSGKGWEQARGSAPGWLWSSAIPKTPAVYGRGPGSWFIDKRDINHPGERAIRVTGSLTL
jgi:hypothetical protein